MAKMEGRYSEGFSDLPGSKITRASPARPLWLDPLSALTTFRNELTIDRGLPFESAVKILDLEQRQGGSGGFRKSRRLMFGRTIHLLAIQKPGHKNIFKVFRPNTGESFFDMEREELENKYEECSNEDVEDEWNRVHATSLVSCMHGSACTQGDACQVGRRVTNVTILSGSVVRVWGVLESILKKYEFVLSRSDRTMRVVRVCLEGEAHLVGVRYPAHLLPEVVATLTSRQVLQEKALKERSGAVNAVTASEAQTEAVTPVHHKSLARALRPPKTVLDFFKRREVDHQARQPLVDFPQQQVDIGRNSQECQIVVDSSKSPDYGSCERVVDDTETERGAKRSRTAQLPSTSNAVTLSFDENLTTLVAMGFKKTRSELALRRAGGNIESAINWML